MKQLRFGACVLVLALLATLGASPLAVAGEVIGAHLEGFSEVPTLSTRASGLFFGRISPDETSIDYILYFELDGGTATVAHIHFGEPGVSGGIAAFLCGGGNKGACPATSGEVTGSVQAGDIIGPASQGLASGDMASLVRAIRKGAAYVNVHTNAFPGGEIRGQIK
jgi:hypothetical protein